MTNPNAKEAESGMSGKTAPATSRPKHTQPVVSPLCELVNFDLDEVDVYNFSFEEIQNEVEEFKYVILGGIMGPGATMKEMQIFVTEIWGQFCPSITVKHNGIWSFKFASQEGCDFVLNNGPWFFRSRFPLALMQWTEDTPLDWSSFESVPAWIQVRNLQPFFTSNHMLSVIASMIGTPVFMDEETSKKQSLDSARMLVQIEPADILKAQVSLRDPSGKTYHLRIWYEWVPWMCHHCMEFGHLSSKCCRKKEENGQKAKECTEEEQSQEESTDMQDTEAEITTNNQFCTDDGSKQAENDTKSPASEQPVLTKHTETLPPGFAETSTSGPTETAQKKIVNNKGKGNPPNTHKPPNKHNKNQLRKHQDMPQTEIRILRSSGAPVGAAPNV